MESARASVFTDGKPVDSGDRGRDSLLLLATLTAGGKQMQVRVRNLSAGGLMAELPDPVSNDAAVEIDLRGVGRVTGRIAWQTEGRAGIAFDRPIDPQRARKPVGMKKDDEAPRPLRFPA